MQNKLKGIEKRRTRLTNGEGLFRAVLSSLCLSCLVARRFKKAGQGGVDGLTTEQSEEGGLNRL
jgi:hypothetical protein